MTIEERVSQTGKFIQELKTTFGYDVTEDEMQELYRYALNLEMPEHQGKNPNDEILWLEGMLSVRYSRLHSYNGFQSIINDTVKPMEESDNDGDETDGPFRVALLVHKVDEKNRSELQNELDELEGSDPLMEFLRDMVKFQDKPNIETKEKPKYHMVRDALTGTYIREPFF